MKAIVSLIALITSCVLSFSQTITVGYDVHFEQAFEVYGHSEAVDEYGWPLGESGYSYYTITAPTDCTSWWNEDYWDTLGGWFHNEGPYTCDATVGNLKLGADYSMPVLANWIYTTNSMYCFAESFWMNGGIWMSFEVIVDPSRHAWIDWSPDPFTEPRLTYLKPIDFGKWAWDGSVNPSWIEPPLAPVRKRGKEHNK